MHWTKLGTDGGVRYDVQLEDDTEVDLVQADGRWKLGYSTSAAEDWSAVVWGAFTTKASCSLLLMTGWPTCWSGRS